MGDSFLGTAKVGEVLTDNPAFTRSILGTADPGEVFRRLDAFCEEHLGLGVGEVLFCELSVGAAFGLRLTDGRRIFLKAHPPDRPPEFLRAVRTVQGHLFGRGFPCPRPVVDPAPFGLGLATVDEFVDEGEHVDAHEPAVRRTMARTLARLVELVGEVRDVQGLDFDERKPVDALVEASKASDLVIVGSRGLHGLESLGSVSERVAHQASCSVLVVREGSE